MFDKELRRYDLSLKGLRDSETFSRALSEAVAKAVQELVISNQVTQKYARSNGASVWLYGDKRITIVSRPSRRGEPGDPRELGIAVSEIGYVQR